MRVRKGPAPVRSRQSRATDKVKTNGTATAERAQRRSEVARQSRVGVFSDAVPRARASKETVRDTREMAVAAERTSMEQRANSNEMSASGPVARRGLSNSGPAATATATAGASGANAPVGVPNDLRSDDIGHDLSEDIANDIANHGGAFQPPEVDINNRHNDAMRGATGAVDQGSVNAPDYGGIENLANNDAGSEAVEDPDEVQGDNELDEADLEVSDDDFKASYDDDGREIDAEWITVNPNDQNAGDNRDNSRD